MWDNHVIRNADNDSNGKITKYEFDKVASSFPEDKREAVFKEMDTDNSGSITKDEFVKVGGMNLQTGYLASALLLVVSLMQ